MRNVDENTITADALSRIQGTADPRLKRIMSSF